MLVLVDFGSIGTFVSTRLVQTLGLSTVQCQQTAFKAADGGQLQCSEYVPHLQWWVQGHTFVSYAKVLELHCYDMIVGEDWLEAVSPVWVDYKTKEMRITYHAKRVALQGVRDQLDSCLEISTKKLNGLIRAGGVLCCLQLFGDQYSFDVSDEVQLIASIQQMDTVGIPLSVQQLLGIKDRCIAVELKHSLRSWLSEIYGMGLMVSCCC